MIIKKILGNKIDLDFLSLKDSDFFTKWFDDPEIMRYFGQKYYKMPKVEVEKYIKSINNQTVEEVAWGIYEKNNSLIGGVGAQYDLINRCAEIWILIGEKSKWGKGYAKESLFLVIDNLFNEYNLHRLEIITTKTFTQAIGLYKSLGFVEEGLRRESDYNYIVNSYEDEIIMGLLKPDWQKLKINL